MLQTHFISGAKFSRPCGLGFVAEKLILANQAQTLGLIISECLCKIYPPQFLRLAESLTISRDSLPSIGDLGMLVHAEVTQSQGVRVLYCLPEWLSPYQKGVDFSFSLQFAPSLNKFVDDYAIEFPWLRKFSINDPEFLITIEKQRNIPLVFVPSWISTDGIEKLAFLKSEIEFRKSELKSEFENTYFLIRNLLEHSQDFMDYQMLDVNDGSLVSGIGLFRRG